VPARRHHNETIRPLVKRLAADATGRLRRSSRLRNKARSAESNENQSDD